MEQTTEWRQWQIQGGCTRRTPPPPISSSSIFLMSFCAFSSLVHASQDFGIRGVQQNLGGFPVETMSDHCVAYSGPDKFLKHVLLVGNQYYQIN